MSKELLFTGLAFAMFVICPRMAGIMHVISKNSQSSILGTILIGTIISIPFLFIMVLTFNKFGLWGALSFCILTDLCSVLIMKEVSLKAGLETLIIAVFVVIGVKIAPVFSKLLLSN